MSKALLAAVLGWSVSSGVAAVRDGERGTIPLPGGVAALAAALGATHPFDRATALNEATRIVYENHAGDSAATDALREKLLAHVASARAQRGGVADTIPLPLAPRTWSDAILGRRLEDDEIALAILESREASLVHFGLSALDAETLDALAGDRSTLARIATRHAAVFAAFGRSLKIRNGRLVIPGEDEARPLWQSLVEASPDDPLAFFVALLEAPGGRLAFLYDTAAHLDEPAQRFLLGLDLPEHARAARFAELARVFAATYPGWRPDRRPFSRPPLDGALLFRLLRIDGRGRLAAPAWPALWSTVFAERVGGPEAGLATEAPPAALASLDPSSSIDAAWVADQVLSRLAVSGRLRLDTILFAQRVFGDRTPADAPAMAVALRGHLAFPALALTLERLGIRDPDLYASAARRAASLSGLGGEASVAVALAEFQSLVAILERARRRGSIADERAWALVNGLVAVEPDPSSGYDGAVARWMDGALLPALFDATGEPLASSSAERAVIRALAGVTGPASAGGPPGSGDTVAWEGRRYRIDPAAAESTRIEAVRARQPGNDLDRVLAFCRAAAEAASPSGPTQALAAAVATAAIGLHAPVLAAAHSSVPLATPQDAARLLMERASRGDSRGAAVVARALPALGDALLADALASIVYAVDLGAPDGPALAGSSVALRHDFGLSIRRVASWQRLAAWEPPREQLDGGWHVTGSLLGLDVALARFALRSLAEEGMPTMPALNANERRTFIESAALLDPRALDDPGMAAIVSAIRTGRRRVEELLADPARLDQVADEAHLSGWRLEALRWSLAHDRETVPRSFSRLELLWLGTAGSGPPAETADAWGMSAVPLTGCWCVELARPSPWEEYGGRPMLGLLATRLPDLTLRVAEELTRLRLPARLAAGVLQAAVYDLLYEAQPAHYEDYLAVVRYVQDLPPERFVDHVSALTARGPLVPADDAAGGTWR